MNASGLQHRLRFFVVSYRIAVVHLRPLAFLSRGELYLVEIQIAVARLPRVSDQSTRAFRLGQRHLVGADRVMQFMSMEAAEDLSPFHIIAHSDQHLSH